MLEQRRNDGGQEGCNSPGTESLLWAQKSPNNVESTFFDTVYLLPKDLRFENGGAKLASCSGCHLTLLRPWKSFVSQVLYSFGKNSD